MGRNFVKDCPKCGIPLEYDPKSGKMTCPKCGYSPPEGEICQFGK